jgi:hypothetical protein
MGASYIDLTYPGSMSEKDVRDKFASDQSNCRYENGHSYSGGIGMANGIKFTGRTFATQAEAETWTQDNAVKWEAAQCSRVRLEPDDNGFWYIGAWCAS